MSAATEFCADSKFGIEISAEQILVLPAGATKEQALDALVDAVSKHPAVHDGEGLRTAVYEREQIMSTGIGEGVAIPHVRLDTIERPVLGVAVAPGGIEYETLDHQPVYLLVLFATPEDADREYLCLLSSVMVALRDDQLMRQLVACRNPQEVRNVLA